MKCEAGRVREEGLKLDLLAAPMGWNGLRKRVSELEMPHLSWVAWA